MKAYKGNIIFTKQKDKFEVYENSFLLVDNGVVQSIVRELPNGGDAIEVVDYTGKLIIPAMNDMHVHAPQYRNQGIAMDLELLPWLNNYTFPEESKFAEPAYAKRVYSRFVRDMWREGTMRSVVFATVHCESTRLLMQLFEKSGMGAFVGKVDMNRNCPDALKETIEQSIRENEALVAEFGGEKNALVKPIITPRFIPSCTPELLSACGKLAAKHSLPVQSHLSENTQEMALVRELEPDSRNYGDAYFKYGLFGQTPTIMAHCVWTRGEELELIKNNNVMVAHCPTSNMNLASGLAPVRSFLDNNIRIGLGSDISGGHELSIFRMMVYAIQTSKIRYSVDKSRPFLTLSEVFWIATKSAGTFFGRVGSFEPGYEFDALVIDDSELNFDDYSLLSRLERFIYLGDDRYIMHRFCRGVEIKEPCVL
ncbi:MAG: amidohydrolase family protein [Paludibacteraceae bacterium]|nr:amidohydrolase family protein [Paludibacteraceae bacterium]